MPLFRQLTHAWGIIYTDTPYVRCWEFLESLLWKHKELMVREAPEQAIAPRIHHANVSERFREVQHQPSHWEGYQWFLEVSLANIRSANHVLILHMVPEITLWDSFFSPGIKLRFSYFIFSSHSLRFSELAYCITFFFFFFGDYILSSWDYISSS